MTTTVYTDGACQGNPGPGGWAWAVPDGPYRSGAEPHTTNQRMEISAALQAVTGLTGPLVVVTDSTYVANCFRDRWWESWVANGWKNKAKKPVANRDLWEPLVDAVRVEPRRVQWRWVKGHGSDPMNDLVDRLAVAAARDQVGQAGTGRPEVLGPADVRAGRSPVSSASGGGEPAPPDGHRLAVAGLRPPGLGGYDANPIASMLRDRFARIIEANRQLHHDLIVLSGLGLGAEQLGAEAALAAGVPYVAVLPFPDQESVWPAAARERYGKLLAGAAAEITLQSRRPESKQAAGAAMARRNAWLARHAHEALIAWDGRDELTGRLVRSFQDHLGEEDVWVVDMDAS